jgi:hypothetical protein
MKKVVTGPQPQFGGPDDIYQQERASAIPRGDIPYIALPAQKKISSQQKPVSASLSELQQWFFSVITHPQSVAGGVRSARLARKDVALEKIVTAGPFCSAQERLQVYHYAYHARLNALPVK